MAKYEKYRKGGEGVERAPGNSVDGVHCAQTAVVSLQCSEVTQPALIEVNILFPLLKKGNSGSVSKQHSHFSHL